jgi:hypothetical protein
MILGSFQVTNHTASIENVIRPNLLVSVSLKNKIEDRAWLESRILIRWGNLYIREP